MASLALEFSKNQIGLRLTRDALRNEFRLPDRIFLIV